MDILVKKAENTDTWDDDIKKLNGSVFMTKSWLSAASSDNRLPVHLYFIGNENTIAMAGGFERITGKGSNKHLFFYSGIAAGAAKEKILKGCKNALLEYARKNNFLRVIHLSYDYNSYVPSRHKNFNTFHRSEYLLDLSREPDKIIKGFDPEVRRRVRKAGKEEVVFRVTNSEEVLEELFQLINLTKEIRKSKGYGDYSALSLPFLDRKAINNLLAEKNAILFYAEDHKGILGVQLLTYCSGKAYGLLMGISQRGYKLGIPSFLAYKGAMFLKNEGFAYYNFGAVPMGKANKGLKKFKESLGAKIIESSEEFTDFLSPHLYYLNPLMKLKRFLYKIRIPWKQKKFYLRILDFIIKGRDQY